jgi:peptidoglycan/xylan/chitin deacetylase (PgdA/CDA1 family)
MGYDRGGIMDLNRTFLLGAVTGGLLLTSACAAPTTVSPPPGEVMAVAEAPRPTGPYEWRSENYVILVMDKPATARELAETYLGGPGEGWRIQEYNGAESFEAGDEVVIPMKSNQPLGVYPDRFQVVPVLCYHRFGGTIKNRLMMPEEEFEGQMAFLKDSGYRVIPLSHLEDFLNGEKALPEKAVVITIDDGYESAYTIAYPILKKHGFPATLFIYTDYIGAGRNALTWEEIREMEESGLITAQSHGKSHADLKKEQQEGNDQVIAELLVPADLIRRKLGHSADYLAYPYGRTSKGVVMLLKKNRYRLGLTVDRGGNAFYENPWILKRNMIYAGEEFDHFLVNLPVEEKIEP